MLKFIQSAFSFKKATFESLQNDIKISRKFKSKVNNFNCLKKELGKKIVDIIQ